MTRQPPRNNKMKFLMGLRNFPCVEGGTGASLENVNVTTTREKQDIFAQNY
jgi:hypothetical protein